MSRPMPTPSDDPVDLLHRDLGFRRLRPWWAKTEIAIGLAAAAAGLVFGCRAATRPDPDPAELAALVALATFGGYLALAGHRSHLYQSNNRLVAYLADLIRRPSRDPS